MSHFYGYLIGNKGEVTRCGSKKSGIKAHLRSWNNDVFVELQDKNGEDCLSLEIPTKIKMIVNGLEVDCFALMERLEAKQKSTKEAVYGY